MEIKIEEIKEIAKKSGEKVLEYYYKDYNISYKDNGGKKSPLTEADLASDKIIMEGLEKYNFPILSEETEDDLSRIQSEYVWIVDPLDGTSDFMEKTGEFSILIGLVKNGDPVLGMVFEPVKNTFYWAEKGKGAFMEKNGKIKKINVSNKDNFQDMTILLSRNHLLESDKKLCENLKIGKQTKRGSTSKMCVIARGDAEIYVNTSDKTGEWDTCAPQVVLTEAGGKIVDMRGKELMYNKKNPKNLNGFVVSNGKNYARIVEELKGVIKS